MVSFINCLLVAFLAQVHCQDVSMYENYTNPKNPCTNLNHVFLTPGVLASGAPNRACLSRFHTTGEALLSLAVSTADNRTGYFRKDLPSGDGGCIDFSVPQLPNTQATLGIRVHYPAHSCTWSSSVTVRVSSSRILILQTSKARYRIGDLLQVRVLALGSDVPRVTNISEIWLEAPGEAWGAGARVAEWSKVRTRLGLTQVQYRIEEYAPKGRWTVRAKLDDGSQGVASFWVGDYSPPPFQLSVKHAPRVLPTTERLVWTVCVRYPWGEAVSGMLVIRLAGAGGSPGHPSPPGSRGVGGTTGLPRGVGVRTALRLEAPRACHRHAVSAARLGLATEGSDVIVAHFSFQEDGTNIWQNTTAVSQVVEKPVTLELLSGNQGDGIAVGLPYKIKVKATRFDDKPASNEAVAICRVPQTTETNNDSLVLIKDGADCSDVITDAGGIGNLYVTIRDATAKGYLFQASLRNDSSILTNALKVPVTNSLAAFGPLVGESHQPSSRVFAPLYLNFKGSRRPVTVHFVVITKGGTLHRWATTTQCPTYTTNVIKPTTSNTICEEEDQTNLDDNLANPKGTESKLPKILLPLRLSQSMCPESRILAYFKYGGKIVSASKSVKIDDCFTAKVESSWSSRKVLPGESTSLFLKTLPHSLCSVTAVDVASKWLLDPQPDIKDIVVAALTRLGEINRNATKLDGCCYSTPSLSPLHGACSSGVRVVGGDDVINTSCDVTRPMALEADANVIPRSDFPETWLYRVVRSDVSGSAVVTSPAPSGVTRYEASVFCITKNGLAVSTPATIQVFKEFFIHLDAPKKVRRGDTFILQYRIFNYLYQPLNVETLILPSPHLSPFPSPLPPIFLSARTSAARRASVVATLAGDASIAIRATAEGNGIRIVDEVVIKIQVKYEGVPVREQKSALLCGKESNKSGSSEITWEWSNTSAVPGSESFTLWASTDVRGPLLADADDLVLLPRGCGEQNMARLATNLLALSSLSPQSNGDAKLHVIAGIARQFEYAHSSGGYSAFGDKDEVPSTWLTAFVVRYMRRAHQAVYPNRVLPPIVERSEHWLMSQQLENGCFRNEGQVFHRELKGGVGEEGEASNVALTAYVVISLLEGAENIPGKLLTNALHCLKAMPPWKNHNMSRVYAQSILTYAFMLLKKHEDDIRRTNEALPLQKKEPVYPGLQLDDEMKELVTLLKMATRSGEYIWWDTGSLSTSIEATGYALLSLSLCGSTVGDVCAEEAHGAGRWLAGQRGGAGGFVATQDTLIALEGMSSWYVPPLGGVLVVSSGRRVPLPPPPSLPVLLPLYRGSTVKVEGDGCALLQATRIYNTVAVDTDARKKSLSVQVSVHTDGPFNCVGESCYCAAVVEVCALWTESFPEMALLEVSLPGGYEPDVTRLYSQVHTRSLVRRIEVSSTIHIYLGPRDGNTINTLGAGHQCIQVYTVGPKTRTKPAYVKILDYYKPEVNDTQTYVIPEECPPKIAPENKDYIRKDNLFASARSIDNEFIFLEDYSIDDLPEGIPLEDPLYDNLEESYKYIPSGNIARTLEVPIETIPKTYEETRINAGLEMAKAEEISTNKYNDSANLLPKETIKNMDKNFDGKSKDEIVTEEKYNSKVKSKIESNNKSETYSHTQETIKELKIESDRTNAIEHSSPLKLLERNDNKVENPKLSDFHVIDSTTDLEVPPGVEGPVPAVVLPPPGFVNPQVPQPSSDFKPTLPNEKLPKTLPYISYYDYYPLYVYDVPSHIRIVRKAPIG